MHELVFPFHFQYAFTPERWIEENMLMAEEIVHKFKTIKFSKGWLGFKVDMQKLYHRVEWKLLQKQRFGFSDSFIKLIW